MIDAIEAYNMMPSVMSDEENKQELLKEIEKKIIESAKQNESSIILQTTLIILNLYVMSQKNFIIVFQI